MSHIFISALNSMDGDNGLWRSPEPFQNYTNRNHLEKRGTAQYISVQSLGRLARELRDADTMVFRLGSKRGSAHTDFALAKTVIGWGDYFLFDDDLFDECPKQDADVDWGTTELLPFSMLPNFTETSHVNFALASGVFEQALGIETSGISVPATGRGTFSFYVRPHRDLDVRWLHNAGQVEIDSVFVGNRRGKRILFVVEAKSGKTNASLSKAKLLYAVSALSSSVPSDIAIVPVYLKVKQTDRVVQFNVAECMTPDPRRETLFINELVCINACAVNVLRRPAARTN